MKILKKYRDRAAFLLSWNNPTVETFFSWMGNEEGFAAHLQKVAEEAKAAKAKAPQDTGVLVTAKSALVKQIQMTITGHADKHLQEKLAREAARKQCRQNWGIMEEYAERADKIIAAGGSKQDRYTLALVLYHRKH